MKVIPILYISTPSDTLLWFGKKRNCRRDQKQTWLRWFIQDRTVSCKDHHKFKGCVTIKLTGRIILIQSRLQDIPKTWDIFEIPHAVFPVQLFEQNAHRTTSSAPLTWEVPQSSVRLLGRKNKPDFSYGNKSKTFFFQFQLSLETSVGTEAVISTAYLKVISPLLLNLEGNYSVITVLLMRKTHQLPSLDD